jgi:hypothetical protein
MRRVKENVAATVRVMELCLRPCVLLNCGSDLASYGNGTEIVRVIDRR